MSILTPDAARDPNSTLAVDEADTSNIALDAERLWQRAVDLRYWLLGIVALAIVLGVAATLLKQPQYRATAQIEISRIDAGATNVEGASIQDETRDAQYYETQYRLLASRTLADEVVEAANLTKDAEFVDAFGLARAGAADRARAIEVLSSHVNIEPVPNSNLVNISVSTPSAKLSARLANLWAEQFLAANYQKRFGSTLVARSQLEKQLAEMRVKLEASEAAANGYANSKEIVVLESATGPNGQTSQQTLVASQLSSLTAALADATARRIAAQSALNAGNGSDAVGTSEASMRARLAEAQAELASSSATLGPKNPKVIALQREITSIRGSLSGENAATNNGLRSAYNKSRMEEQELERRFNSAKSRYLAQQGEGVQLGILKREADTNRELYDALLQRYKELGVADTGANNMSIVEPAVAPSAPYEPSLTKNLLIALAIALIVIGVVVFAADQLDSAVRDPAQISREFGLPVLGLIPDVQDANLIDELRDPNSLLSEAYAAARSSIAFSTTDGAPRSLMVTSTRPEEGKTITSVALARIFARLGHNVVLIDMDLRRRGVSRLLNAKKCSADLPAFLAGAVDFPEAVTVEDGLPLKLIPSCTRSPNPAELLAGTRAKGLIAELEKTYDLVIIDGPPVLGLADAPEIARVVGGVAYVIEANGGSRRVIRQALSRLRRADARMVGAIVTHLDRRNERYGYGYGYGYGYSYDEVA